MSGEPPVNLRQARKRAARAAEKRTAEANALRHGLSKAAKAQAKAEGDRARAHLDGHRREE